MSPGMAGLSEGTKPNWTNNTTMSFVIPARTIWMVGTTATRSSRATCKGAVPREPQVTASRCRAIALA